MKKRTYHNPVGVSKYTGLLLILPFIAGAAVFLVYPFISSFVIGLTEYDMVHEAEFVGIGNYRKVLNDSAFTGALEVTLKYTLLLVPAKLIVSLLVALLLSAEIRGIGIFRTAFYIPSILGANLAVVIMWQYLFTTGGLIDQFLELLGVSPVSWYGEPEPALFIIILLRLWEFGSTMVIFLTALKSIPRELYDAAKVDGCGAVRAFLSITLPQLKNVIFINLVLQIIASMQEFNAPYMITGGGPLKRTYTIGMLIYDEMFRFYDAGTANAVSWLLFVMIAVIVGAAFLITGRQGREEQ